jgi:hypothetical protein
VHVPVTIGNIVTFSYTQSKKEPANIITIHRVRHDIDWFDKKYNAIGIEKSLALSFFMAF